MTTFFVRHREQVDILRQDKEAVDVNEIMQKYEFEMEESEVIRLAAATIDDDFLYGYSCD
jgi:hypothetical protein